MRSYENVQDEPATTGSAKNIHDAIQNLERASIMNAMVTQTLEFSNKGVIKKIIIYVFYA